MPGKEESVPTQSAKSVHTRSSRGPTIAIVIGLVIAGAHLALGITDVMTATQWISGVVIGLSIAGAGNHRRIFGRQ
jgi:type IV secretory pathway VirB2 component (pilin)